MKKLLAALLIAAFSIACSEAAPADREPAGGGQAAPAGDGAGSEGVWTLESGRSASGEIEIAGGTEITLEILGGKARGSAGCNTYGGSVVVDGGTFDAGGFAVTEIGCPEPLVEPEERYLEALEAADAIAVEGDAMTLTGPDTELVFSRVPPIDTKPLTGTTWILESLVDGETASSAVTSAKPARLEIHDDGTLEGTTGCRFFSGSWSTSGDVVSVTQLVFDGTCKRGAEQDAHVAAAIGTGFRAEVEEDRLTLTSEKGRFGLVYRAR